MSRKNTSVACGDCEENFREPLELSCKRRAGSETWTPRVAFFVVLIILVCAYSGGGKCFLRFLGTDVSVVEQIWGFGGHVPHF